MRILLIDNADSFTYNLFQYLIANRGVEVLVFSPEEGMELDLNEYDMSVISPGPGLPEESSMLMKIIEKLVDVLPIYGICLGHQAIHQYHGGTLYQLEQVRHGFRSRLCHLAPSSIYARMNEDIYVGRYHSWAIRVEDIHEDFFPTAFSEDGCVMGLKHRTKKIETVQFHPESIMTSHGRLFVSQFIDEVRERLS